MRVVVLFFTALLVKISDWFYTWGNTKCDGKLPPGSMGLPIIGETIEFFSPHALYDIPPVIRKRMAGYGPVCRTSVVGQKVVVSTDPEINYNIFQQENKSFLTWSTESFNKILGQQIMLAHHGMVHKYLRNLILHLVSPEKLKGKLLHEMDEVARRHLNLWSSHGTVDLKEGTSNMIFEYFAKMLISYDETKAARQLRENYTAFVDGLISFPLNIPGTAYIYIYQGRKNVIKVIKDIFEERKASKTPPHNFLDHLLDEVKKEDTILNEAIAIDLVFVLLFASYETTSRAITLLVKFIDHPEVLTELSVINETVRLANIVPGIFRKVVKDVEMKGYTIPAGWIVMVVPSVVHLNPDKYEDPLAFNPWRWEGQELHAGSKTFMAFGGGVKLCAGADFPKLQMTIFLHYFVTKDRWLVIKGGDIIRRPGLTFPNGLHIEICRKN